MFPQDARPLIPQKHPFVMVDELLYADDISALSGFIINTDNPFCIDGVFQEGGLLENMAQTAAAHSGFIAAKGNGKVKKGFIGAVNNLEIFELPKQGDLLRTEIKITDQVFNVTVVSGEVFRSSLKLASAKLKIFVGD